MVSVIITTFNRKKFLRDAVMSVLGQEYNDKEVIIVDDGSTDDSCEEIEGLPVRYVWKANAGISSARNFGIRVTEGEYIAFLDVDDIWHKKKLSLQMELMEAEGFSISYTNELWIRDGKKLNQRLRHKKYSGFIFEHCLPLCIISPSSAVIRREIFDTVGLFDESLPVCEDYDMWLRIAAQYPILFVDEPLIIKRGGHGDQLSRRYEAMDKYRIQSLEKLLHNGSLDNEKREKVISELEKKCMIYAQGALKRGKIEEGEEYLSIMKKYRRN